MTRRWVRFALFLLVVATLGVTGWFTFDHSRRTEADHLALGTMESSARRLLAALAETRAGLQAHLAYGQDAAVWRDKVGDNIRTLETELSRLRDVALEPAGQNDLDAAAAAIDDVAGVNERVERLVRNEQPWDAAQAVYRDGFERLDVASQRIESVWQAERAAADARRRAGEMRLAYVAGTAVLLVLLTVALLLPAGRVTGESAPETLTSTSGRLFEPSAAPRVAETPVVPQESTEPAPAQPEPTAGQADSPTPGRPDRRKTTELKAMAELCTDFARLTDSGELPALLERAARLIDASGFIVWVTSATGAELRPALAHGYPASAVARLPAIPRDADNATAAAWRECDVRIVRTNGMTPGALVVPLLTSGGCIGAFAAEVRHGREASESVRALTRIVAAQLAQLVSVPPAEAGAPATAEHASPAAAGN